MADWIAERSPAPWRLALRMASYKDAPFHVEAGGKTSGRRVVLHEYPKRDLPYAEDMGRRAIQYQITGYLIVGDRRLGIDYRVARDRLIDQLENSDGGLLVHPTLGELEVVPGPYSITESRERGGFCIFEMIFLEAGVPADYTARRSTSHEVQRQAKDAASAVTQSFAKTMTAFAAETP